MEFDEGSMDKIIIDAATSMRADDAHEYGYVEGEEYSIPVGETFLPDGGHLVVFGTFEGENRVVGSTYLPPGTHENVRVSLDRSVEARLQLGVLAARDTNGNGELDVETDQNYVHGGDPVYDTAVVNPATPTATATPSPSPTATSTPTATRTFASETGATPPTVRTDAPGFGPVAALGGLIGAALLVLRRR